jgi:serine/threonine protein kinase
VNIVTCICQQIAAVFKIGNSKELPPIPDHLSENCKDLIRKCMQRDPSQRPTAVELLQHPFIQNGSLLEKSVASDPLQHLTAISCRPNPKVQSDCYLSDSSVQTKNLCICLQHISYVYVTILLMITTRLVALG